MLKKIAILSLFLGPFCPALQAANPLDSIAKQIARGLKNAGLKSAAVMEFQYADGASGLGGPKIQSGIIESLSKGGLAAFSKVEIDSATRSLGLEPGSAFKPD